MKTKKELAGIMINPSELMAYSKELGRELDLEALARTSSSPRQIREFVQEFKLQNGKAIFLLGEGRLVNLAAAEGHPSAVMDMSFANQSLAAEYIAKNHASLEKKVYPMPAIIDQEIARLKLAAMGIEIDTLTPEQEKYLASYDLGT